MLNREAKISLSIIFYSFCNVYIRDFRHVTKEGGGLPCPYLKIKKSALILGKKALIVSILGLNLPLKL